MIEAQEVWRKEIGKPKREIVTMQVPDEVTAEARSLIAEKVIPTLLIESRSSGKQVGTRSPQKQGSARREIQ